MKIVKKAMVYPSQGLLSKDDHCERNGHSSFVLWLTGLSGAGKSSLAQGLQQELHLWGWSTYVLDGDTLRSGLNSDLGFSNDDRTENIRRTGEVAKLFVDAGVVVIAAFISPFQKDRETVRALFEPGEYVEVFVQCDMATCEKRDPKGLYRKARAGLLPQFTGIDSPYEEPENPELIIDTARFQLEESVEMLSTYVKKNYGGPYYAPSRSQQIGRAGEGI